MRFSNAINLRYLVDRFHFWKFNRSHPDAPWLTPQAVSILSTWLKPTDLGLEWGSGKSTVWLSKRIAHLVSMESNPEWFSKVQKMMNGTKKVDLRYEGDESGYVSVTEEISPLSLDFVLVDGALARDVCAHRAIPLLKPGGMLVLDNANWYLQNQSNAPGSRRPGDNSRSDAASWDDFLLKVARWRHIWTSNGVTCTAFWIRPLETPLA
jgi:predicted O-methyltransferase YrrM